MWNPGQAFLGPQGHNLNKLGKGSLEALELVVSDKIFYVFPL